MPRSFLPQECDPIATTALIVGDLACTMPRVGVIGAGISGLLCAQRLASAPGLTVTVFEWGRGPGGRTARRRVTLPEHGGEVSFDHAAPFFTATSSDFRSVLQEWEQAGAAARWPLAGEDAWVGVPSNHAICLTPRQPLRRSPSDRGSALWNYRRQ